MDTVIEIKHLEKHFGDLRVLNDIDFTIERGDRKSTRQNSSHGVQSRMPSSA